MPSKGPAEPLQHAIYAALMSSADVRAVFGSVPPRIFDTVPSDVFPRITLGDDQILDDSHCEAAFEANCTVHVWSRSSKRGKTEAKDIGDAVIAALSSQLAIAGFVHVFDASDPDFQSAQYFYEPDGLTAHGVLVFRFMIDQAIS